MSVPPQPDLILEKSNTPASVSTNGTVKQTDLIDLIVSVAEPLLGLVYGQISTQMKLQHGTNEHYDGVFDAVNKISREEGVLGFGKGFLARLFGLVLQGTTMHLLVKNFDVLPASLNMRYNEIEYDGSHYVTYWRDNMDVFQKLVGARLLVETVGYPFKTIAVMQQSEKTYSSNYLNALNTGAEALASGGITRLYKGFHLQLLNIGAFAGSAYLADRAYVDYFLDKTKEPISNERSLVSIASLTLLFSYLLTSPINLVQLRLQAGDRSYSGTWDAFSKIYEEEGFLGFYKGTLPYYVLNGLGRFFLGDNGNRKKSKLDDDFSATFA